MALRVSEKTGSQHSTTLYMSGRNCLCTASGRSESATTELVTRKGGLSPGYETTEWRKNRERLIELQLENRESAVQDD